MSINKIDGGSGRIKGSSVRRTGRGDSVTSDAFAKEVKDGVSGPEPLGTASSAAPLSGINGLLALQEVDDATDRASRGRRRAEDILRQLDDLRHGLLAGGLPRAKLLELTKAVQSRRGQIDDPHLARILDEVDLRAQVELAKYGH